MFPGLKMYNIISKESQKLDPKIKNSFTVSVFAKFCNFIFQLMFCLLGSDTLQEFLFVNVVLC